MAHHVYAEVDVSQLPLVVVEVVGPLTEDGFQAYLSELLEAVQLRPRVVVRMHAGSLGAYPPRFVRESVMWIKEHSAILTRHIVAVRIVAEQSVLRMATQAMVWAARPAFPITVTNSKTEADAWLLALLEEDSP